MQIGQVGSKHIGMAIICIDYKFIPGGKYWKLSIIDYCVGIQESLTNLEFSPINWLSVRKSGGYGTISRGPIVDFLLALHAGTLPSPMNIWCMISLDLQYRPYTENKRQIKPYHMPYGLVTPWTVPMYHLSPSSKNSSPDPAWSIKIQSINKREFQIM